MKAFKGGDNLKTKTINDIRDGIAIIVYFIALMITYQNFGVNKTTFFITGLFTLSMFIFKNDEILRVLLKRK